MKRGDEHDINKILWHLQINAGNSVAALADLTNYNFHSFERSGLLYRNLGDMIFARLCS